MKEAMWVMNYVAYMLGNRHSYFHQLNNIFLILYNNTCLGRMFLCIMFLRLLTYIFKVHHLKITYYDEIC